MSDVVVHDKPAAVWKDLQPLAEGCGIYRLDQRAKLQLTGSDRVRWLNGMVSNNIRDLALGHGVYAFLLSPQGRILGDMWAYNLGETILLDTDRSQVAKLRETFEHYIIMDDVEVADVSETIAAIGLSGPKASDVLKSAGFDSSTLQPLEIREIAWEGLRATIVRGEWNDYAIWCAPHDQQKVWDAISRTGGQAVKASALEVQRVLRGVPQYGVDIRERDLPQETGQERALNYSKGCYIGQEIVERIRSRGAVHRHFVGFAVEGTLPSPGTKVQADGKEVGEITSAVALPAELGDFGAAIGYIRREFSTEGKAVSIDGSPATVRELPFKGTNIV